MHQNDSIMSYYGIRRNVKQVIGALTALLFMFILFHPGRHAKYYHYEVDEDILSLLIPDYLLQKNGHLKFCDYQRIIHNQLEIIRYEDYLSLPETGNLQNGGLYEPQDCQALFSTAIIVPYRNRTVHLEIFLKYMHKFLQTQKIRYKIFLAEQNNSEPFNRAMMFNYGSYAALTADFPCLILHDVDLLPINTGNLYACSRNPRHMSSSVDTMRFNLPYHEIAGGVLAIQSEQFKMVNGMSNEYNGWGGEDDDFFMRLSRYQLTLSRFSPKISQYVMLKHKKEIPSSNRYDMLRTASSRQQEDGLNSLNRKFVTKLEDLFTHVIVN